MSPTLGAIGLGTPSSLSLSNNLLSESINNTNNICDRWSPCLRPRRCQIRGHGLPLSNTRVLAVQRRMATSLRNLVPNPAFWSTSKSIAQDTESNARAMSSLSITCGSTYGVVVLSVEPT
jgi:hypothetical protein